MDPLKEMAWALPDAVSLVSDGGRWTHGELDQEVEAMARRLAGAGARPGVRVVLVLPLRVETVIAVHAVPRTGATLAPLNPRWTASELRTALEALEPAVIVCDDSTSETVLQALRGTGGSWDPVGRGSPGGTGRFLLVTVDPAKDRSAAGVPGDTGGEEGEWLAVAPRTLESVPPDPGPLTPLENEEVMAILWTTGTAGRPRGVELTGHNLKESARAARKALGLRTSDSWYASLPVAHVGGLALVIRASVIGCRLVVRSSFRASDFNELVDAREVTHASLVPTMLLQALDDREDRPPPASLRCVLVGGAHTPMGLVTRALACGFPLALTYGMTETTSQVATAPPQLVREKPGTVGSPLPGVQLRVPPGGGEIRVRGSTVAHRYFRRSATIADGEGWFRTGDLGELDAQGHLWITGRLSDRIVTGGVNVDPAEVEAVLRRHPGVAEVAVLGIPDSLWGERVAAGVVPAPGSPSGALLATELESLSREHLSSAKRPREIRILDALPVGVGGKLDRAALRLALSDGGGGDSASGAT